MQFRDIDTRIIYEISVYSMNDVLESNYQSDFKKIVQDIDEFDHIPEIKYASDIYYLVQAHQIGWVRTVVNAYEQRQKIAPIMTALDYYKFLEPKYEPINTERLEKPRKCIREMFRAKGLHELANQFRKKNPRVIVRGECLVQAIIGVYWPCPIEIILQKGHGLPYNNNTRLLIKQQRVIIGQFKDKSLSIFRGRCTKKFPPMYLYKVTGKNICVSIHKFVKCYQKIEHLWAAGFTINIKEY